MVWPFTSSDDGDTKSSKGDPYRDLDPTLRKFLEKESPLKYNTSQPKSPPTKTPQPPPNPSPDPTQAPPNPSRSRSLFSDGRYDHLWSTYRPKEDIDNEHKSDQEKLLDVLNAYKERKASIGNAALENCALQQWEVNDCFRTGTWGQRMKMCRDESRALDRCYEMNSRFLKALGYLSTWDRPSEVEEQIQMHADALYNRMLEQEKQIAEAKAAGKEAPRFGPLFEDLPAQGTGPRAAQAPLPKPRELEMLNADARVKFEKKVKDMSPQERELEERAFAAELALGIETSHRLERHRNEVKEAKQARKEQGQETVTDKLSSFFGW